MADRARYEPRVGGHGAGDPRPLGGLADLADLLGGDSDRSRRLLGGLAIGALAGAAIAGALIRARSAGGPGRRRG